MMIKVSLLDKIDDIYVYQQKSAYQNKAGD